MHKFQVEPCWSEVELNRVEIWRTKVVVFPNNPQSEAQPKLLFGPYAGVSTGLSHNPSPHTGAAQTV